jgi:hypothetical protein
MIPADRLCVHVMAAVLVLAHSDKLHLTARTGIFCNAAFHMSSISSE